MKKILLVITLFVAVIACDNKEALQPEISSDRQIVDGMLKVDFTVCDPSFKPVTKALGNTLDVDHMTMKVVVFDQYGVYLSQSDAELKSTGAGTGTYSAYFPVSEKEEKRIVHFLGNFNETVEYGTELEVISQLTTNNDVDGYWQRDEVTNLKAHEVNGNMELDYKAQLNNIVLVRNFCKMTVSSSTSKLEIKSAMIYNVPNSGSIAPYSSNKSGFVGSTKSGFITDYHGYTTPDSLISKGYNACVPLDRAFIETVTDPGLLKLVNSSGKVELFCYEREMPIDNPPFVIVGGNYDGSSTTTYYRINLRDQEENGFPLLRNFNYLIDIAEVRKAGESTVQDAINSAGSGDVSSDIRLSNLTEISNGEARMMVTTTEYTFVTDDPFVLKYKFIPNISTFPDTPSNGTVTIKLKSASSAGNVFENESKIVQADADDSEGWRNITLTPNPPGTSPRKQSIVITGSYTDPSDSKKTLTISRTINFILREKPSFTVKCVDDSGNEIHSVNGAKETPVTVKIGIPGGLPSSMFPVMINIEAQKRTLSPDPSKSNNILPIVTGKSLFDNTKPGYHFVKTIQYSEYSDAEIDSDGNKNFNVYFKTNIANSATSIIVTNEKFNSASTSFTNP